RAHHRLHLRHGRRGARAARRHHSLTPLLVRRRPRPVPGGRNSGHLCTIAGRQHRADFLCLRIHQRWHGERIAASRRRAAAARQLRWHFDGDPARGLRYSDVTVFASEADRHVMHRIARTWIVAVLFVSGSALADGSFSGRTRFDLDRAEIRDFVEATAAAQKLEPLEVYRLLAKAEPQPRIIELISKPAEKVAPWWQYRER